MFGLVDILMADFIYSFISSMLRRFNGQHCVLLVLAMLDCDLRDL